MDTFIKTCMDLLIRRGYWRSLVIGVQTTIIMAILGTLFGSVVGMIVGGIRAIKVEQTAPAHLKYLKKAYDILAWIYIEVFRGTPMMVQGVFIYYLLKPIFRWTPMVAGVVIIAVNTGSYMAEIIRSGIQSVDKGQNEAARSLGMSALQSMFHVVMPQGIRNSFPAMCNEFIVNIKDSSVLNAISVTELYFQTSSMAGSTYKYKESFFVAAMIYLVLTTVASFLMRRLEKFMSMRQNSFPASQTVKEAIDMNISEKSVGGSHE